jgi:hypothetical protein
MDCFSASNSFSFSIVSESASNFENSCAYSESDFGLLSIFFAIAVYSAKLILPSLFVSRSLNCGPEMPELPFLAGKGVMIVDDVVEVGARDGDARMVVGAMTVDDAVVVVFRVALTVVVEVVDVVVVVLVDAIMDCSSASNSFSFSIVSESASNFEKYCAYSESDFGLLSIFFAIAVYSATLILPSLFASKSLNCGPELPELPFLAGKGVMIVDDVVEVGAGDGDAPMVVGAMTVDDVVVVVFQAFLQSLKEGK